MRYRYYAVVQDLAGNVVSGASVSVYLAGTTTPANVYTSPSGGTGNSTPPQLITGEDGVVEFWLEHSEYSYGQLFKLVVQSDSLTKTIDNVQIINWATTPYTVDATGASNNQVVVFNVTAQKLQAGVGVYITSSGNVGIGVAAPGQKLTVVGNIGLQAGADAFVGTLDNYALSLRTNNTDRIFINTLGNVGIGTTTPSQALHVVGNILATGTGTFQSSPLTVGNLVLSASGLTASRTFTFPDVSDTVVGASVTQTLTNKTMSTGCTWNGNVIGVGYGGTGLSSVVSGALLYGSGGSALNTLTIGSAGTILSSNGTAPQWSTPASLNIPTGTGSSGAVVKWTGTNTVGSSVITDTGSAIGIGVSVPAQKLTVAGNIAIQAGANAFIGTLDNYALSLRTNNTDRVYIDTSGNVGIGVSAPGQKLDVAGNVGVSGQFISTVATGTAPLSVSSTTLCTNLNADMVDGYHVGNNSGQVALSNGTVCANLNADMVDGYHVGNSSGQVALSNGTVCTNLNADMVDSLHADDFIAMSFFFGG